MIKLVIVFIVLGLFIIDSVFILLLIRGNSYNPEFLKLQEDEEQLRWLSELNAEKEENYMKENTTIFEECEEDEDVCCISCDGFNDPENIVRKRNKTNE